MAVTSDCPEILPFSHSAVKPMSMLFVVVIYRREIVIIN